MCKKTSTLFSALIVLFTLVYLVLMRVLNYGEWWSNAAPVFMLGILWAQYEKHILNFVIPRFKTILFLSMILFGITATYDEVAPHLLIRMISVFFWAITVMLITYKFELNNPFVLWCSRVSLYIYLSHSTLLRLVQGASFLPDTPFLQSIIVIAGTLLLSAFIFSIKSFRQRNKRC